VVPVPTNNVLVPMPVATSLRFTELAVGLQHACGSRQTVPPTVGATTPTNS
jgi:hypothetical protein